MVGFRATAEMPVARKIPRAISRMSEGIRQSSCRLIRRASGFTAGLLCPHKIDGHDVLVLASLLIGRRPAGPLFVLIPPVRSLAHLDDVVGTVVFARVVDLALFN